MPAIPVEFPSAEYPAPSSGPQPSPAEPVQAPPPAPLATPVFAPAPVFPPSATVSRDIAPVPAPGSTHFEPQLGPGPAPAPNRLINVTVQLQGQNNLNSSGAAALQAVLANLTGQGELQYLVEGYYLEGSWFGWFTAEWILQCCGKPVCSSADHPSTPLLCSEVTPRIIAKC